MSSNMPYNSTLLYTVRYHTKNTLKQFAWVNKKKRVGRYKETKWEVVWKCPNEIKKKWMKKLAEGACPQQSFELTFYIGPQQCFGSCTEKVNKGKPLRKKWWHHWPHHPDWFTFVEILAGLIKAAPNQSEYYVKISRGCPEEMKIVE